MDTIINTTKRNDKEHAISTAFQQLTQDERSEIAAQASVVIAGLRVKRNGMSFNLDLGVELVGKLALFLAQNDAFKKMA
jgi:hypothetical protein